MGAEINILLVIIAAFCITIYILSAFTIYDFHKKRNDKTPGFLLFNFIIFRYVEKYKMITKAETHHSGPLFYLWAFSFSLMLICAVLFLLVNLFILKGSV